MLACYCDCSFQQERLQHALKPPQPLDGYIAVGKLLIYIVVIVVNIVAIVINIVAIVIIVIVVVVAVIITFSYWFFSLQQQMNGQLILF